MKIASILLTAVFAAFAAAAPVASEDSHAVIPVNSCHHQRGSSPYVVALVDARRLFEQHCRYFQSYSNKLVLSSASLSFVLFEFCASVQVFPVNQVFLCFYVNAEAYM
ncbi:hypothetical protein BO85DRAFT_519833 [Aspergillus piperis CBS 112811]|uniref:Uncharacterized protein n=1 Tax=Aspergillus piperis CBS 112811 TaxID=1448313 RepID=A0A8G1R3E2_9EURO|nr:hypothetical protein BO85DRAFT_519833 [Aspergillus piperis CBS 112811]RAH57931.1 hypothetical protein BO85DRAFT_519833 [Aspergillus piperis CBS 112811]